MTIRQFIRENKKEIDRHIEISVGKKNAIKTNHERELFVRNDQALYNMAVNSGVNFN